MNKQITRNAVKAAVLSMATLTLMLPFQNCSPGFEQAANSSLNMSSGLSQAGAFGKSGLRRLTRKEFRNTLNDIFAVDPGTLTDFLPEDMAATIPFDNEAAAQSITDFIVMGYNTFAETYASMVASDAGVVQRLAGCTPQAADDQACFEKFAKQAGRRILRRPVTSYELQRYSELILPFARSEQNFGTAVNMLVQVWAQHPSTLYRIEAGNGFQPEPGVMQLEDFEIATRMSYLLWGSAPDDQLLDAAQQGKLKDANEREAQASRMLNDLKARRQMQTFHAQWFGFESRFLEPNLEADMRQESAALIDRVVFDLDREWMAIFNWNETYVTPALAQFYGMAPVTKTGWAPYTGVRGGGILSHGSFLSLGAKFGDTSPTLRGYEIYKRLFCGKLGTVPPGVDVDNPPGNPTDCKEQRYSMRQNQACASCHNITDNIGFGLENYGPFGDWRTTEPGRPDCPISGEGAVSGNSYKGPRQLAELLSNSDGISQCATKQLFRFMTGRMDDQNDSLTLEAMKIQYTRTPSLKSMLVALVRSPGIMHK